MHFPKEIKDHILSFLPVTPRFRFDTEKQCILHKMLFAFDTGASPVVSGLDTKLTNKNNLADIFVSLENFVFYTNNYYLKDNNYLQNEIGDTPLHIAYYYNNKWAIYILEQKAPEMKNIINNNGILPKNMIYEYMPIEIDYPQDMEEWGATYLARY